MRDGTDYLTSVAYNHEYLAMCPVTAVEQPITAGSAVGWDMTGDTYSREYLATRRDERPAAAIANALKIHAQTAGDKADFSMHFFRSVRRQSQGP